MGNIGGPEIIVVLIIALLVLGPNRLPQAARQMGKAMAEFRKVTGGLQAEVRDAMSQLENEVSFTEPPGPPEIPAVQPPTPPLPPAPAPPSGEETA
ncbi:MAG: sec-independent protein translocase protein TatB [Actinomycetota bacterium]